MLLRMLPIVASFWLLAAHFLRYGAWVPCLLLIAFPLLLILRHRLVPYMMSISLGLVALKWLQVTYSMITIRLMMGDDWLRLSVIMASVVCFTLMSACIFQSRRSKDYYQVSTH